MRQKKNQFKVNREREKREKERGERERKIPSEIDVKIV